MKLIIDGKVFTFHPCARVIIDGDDLDIIDPGFKEENALLLGWFTNKTLILPKQIRKRVNRTGLKPCSRLYQDKAGRKKLSAYFD